MKPFFVDNREGNTLAVAITSRLGALRREGHPVQELCIATAYFNPQGLELLSTEAQHVSRIRLLLGTEPTPEAQLTRRDPFDPPEPEFTRRRVRSALERMDRSLRGDRDPPLQQPA